MGAPGGRCKARAAGRGPGLSVCPARSGWTTCGARAAADVRGRAGVPGCDRGLGVGHRVGVLGGDAEELLQVLAGDQAAPADLDVGQPAAGRVPASLAGGRGGGVAGRPGT